MSDSISGIVLSVSCVCVWVFYYCTYITHTKNYAEADFGSHNYESESKIFTYIQICNKFLKFLRTM